MSAKNMIWLTDDQRFYKKQELHNHDNYKT